MKILIQTIVQDSYAAAVAAVLKNRGVHIVLSVGSDVPRRQFYSFSIDGDDEVFAFRRDVDRFTVDHSIDLVWGRRVKLVDLPDMHPDDAPIAQNEFELYLDGFWSAAVPDAIWINPWEARKRANSKLVQLLTARECGFALSPTLMSHDPEQIRAFVTKHDARNTIFKPFSLTGWSEGDRRFATPTTVLTEDALDDDESLSICPGIYQVFIPKRKELRVTVMGDEVHCADIDVSHVEGAQTDWRTGQDDARVTRFDLPEDVRARCLALLRALNLRFGCIDLILGEDGRYYFLEINEMGQFLWIERLNPELRYLEAFVAFLLSFSDKPIACPNVALADVMASADYIELMEGELAVRA